MTRLLHARAHEPETAFRPRPRLQVPWSRVAIATGAALALPTALLGALLLAGRAPPAAAPLAGRGMDCIALAILLGASAPAILVWQRNRRLRALDARLPDLLTDLAGLHKAGLTLAESVATAAKGDYGPLTADVRIASDQVRWNIPVLTVLDNLRRRVGTPLAERTLAVVIEAGRTGGHVPEVLETSAENARSVVALRDQRARTMGLYTIITYVAAAIFIGVALALQGVFVPRMVSAFGQVGGGLSLAGSIPTPEEFRNLFYSAALVQAVGNGMVGGIMGEGSLTAGVRHSVVLVLLCFLGFLMI